jgi:hypothetical protein
MDCVPNAVPPRLVRVNGMYRLKEKIGSGSFGMSQFSLRLLAHLQFAGDVYSGFNIFTSEPVAVKVEAGMEDEYSELENEDEIYKQLEGCCTVPKVHFFGTESNFNVLVTDLLGPSLQDLLKKLGRGFSLKTTVLLAEHLVGFYLSFRIHRLDCCAMPRLPASRPSIAKGSCIET